jgi:hypothetical protein
LRVERHAHLSGLTLTDVFNNLKDEVVDVRRLQHVNQINKKKKSKTRKMEKALATVRKKDRQKQKAENFNFSALHLLNDPQGLYPHCNIR